MLTLSFGFKKPVSGDLGPTVFPALEDNWQQVNDHDHDGTNSKKIASSSIEAITQNISSLNWVSVGNGLYEQTITMPAAVVYDNVSISFRYNNEFVLLKCEKVAAAQYKVTTNLNTADYVAIYR